MTFWNESLKLHVVWFHNPAVVNRIPYRCTPCQAGQTRPVWSVPRARGHFRVQFSWLELRCHNHCCRPDCYIFTIRWQQGVVCCNFQVCVCVCACVCKSTCEHVLYFTLSLYHCVYSWRTVENIKPCTKYLGWHGKTLRFDVWYMHTIG